MRLSIIVDVTDVPRFQRGCLPALQALPPGDWELVLFVAPQVAFLISELAPFARLCLAASSSTPAQRHAQAATLACGERLAFLQQGYAVSAAWLSAACRAHAPTGGCVAAPPRLSLLGWSMYLTEYAHIAPPTGFPPASGNLVFPRAYLPAGKLDRTAKEPAVRIDPALTALYVPQTLPSYLAERYAVSRAYACGRPSVRLITPLGLPLLVPFRIARNVAKRRPLWRHFGWALPGIVALSFVQVAGEIAGGLSRAFAPRR